MLEQDPVEGRQRETKENRSGNHVGTGSNRRETNGDRPGIMLEQDPIEGGQRETNGDRPGIMLEQDPVEGRQMETDLESCWNRIQ